MLTVSTLHVVATDSLAPASGKTHTLLSQTAADLADRSDALSALADAQAHTIHPTRIGSRVLNSGSASTILRETAQGDLVAVADGITSSVSSVISDETVTRHLDAVSVVVSVTACLTVGASSFPARRGTGFAYVTHADAADARKDSESHADAAQRLAHTEAVEMARTEAEASAKAQRAMVATGDDTPTDGLPLDGELFSLLRGLVARRVWGGDGSARNGGRVRAGLRDKGMRADAEMVDSATGEAVSLLLGWAQDGLPAGVETFAYACVGSDGSWAPELAILGAAARDGLRRVTQGPRVTTNYGATLPRTSVGVSFVEVIHATRNGAALFPILSAMDDGASLESIAVARYAGKRASGRVSGAEIARVRRDAAREMDAAQGMAVEIGSVTPDAREMLAQGGASIR